MMKQLVHILLLLSLCYLPACKEKAPKPGTERFYCRVNGKAFRPHSGGDFFNHPVYAEWDTRFFFNLYGFNHRDDYYVIMAATLNNTIIEVKEYSTKDSTYFPHYGGDFIKIDDRNKQNDFLGYEGTLTISKYDAESKLVSGTFEFKAKSRYTDETVEVTKGQFNDVHVYGGFN